MRRHWVGGSERGVLGVGCLAFGGLALGLTACAADVSDAVSDAVVAVAAPPEPLRAPRDAALTTPEFLTPDGVIEDAATLRTAVLLGYAGVHHAPRSAIDAALAGVDAAAGAPDNQAFCDALADALATLPDPSIAVRNSNGLCGAATTVSEPASDTAPLWAFETRALGPAIIGVLRVTRFAPADDPNWDGFEETLGALSVLDAAVIDLSGAGGASAPIAHAMAGTLSAEPAPARSVITVTTAEAHLLRANMAEARGAERVLVQAHERAARTARAAPAAPFDIVAEPPADVSNAPASTALGAPVAVMIDARCGTSCVDVATAAAAAENAVLIGPTVIRPVEARDLGRVFLANARIDVVLPTAVVRPSDPTGAGAVTPDITPAAGEDARAAALTWVRAELGLGPRTAR